VRGGRCSGERRKKGLSEWQGGQKEAPAGAGVIVDIQRGKCAISRPHKFSQSDEPPRAAALSLHARGSGVTCVQAAMHRSVGITSNIACTHTRAPTRKPESDVRIVYPRTSNAFRPFQNFALQKEELSVNV